MSTTMHVSMIPDQIDTQSQFLNAWKAWVLKFLTMPVTPMDEKLCARFIDAVLFEKSLSEGFPDAVKAAEQLTKHFSYEVASKRLKSLGVSATPAVILIVCQVSKNPAEVVMYCHVLAYVYAKTRTTITTQELADTFPVGFLTEDAVHEMWDAQKHRLKGVQGDNFLDIVGAEDMKLYFTESATAAV